MRSPPIPRRRSCDGARMTGKRGSYRAALRHPDCRRVLLGLTVSQIGDWLANVALIVFVFDATHSATWVAATTAMRLTPWVLFGAVGGEIADRFERRAVMIACDLIRVILMLGLAVVAQTSGPVPLAGLLAFLTTTAATFLPSGRITFRPFPRWHSRWSRSSGSLSCLHGSTPGWGGTRHASWCTHACT